MPVPTLPVFTVLLVAAIWGFSFLFTKDALAYLLPFQLLGLRFALATLCLLALALTGKVKIMPEPHKLPRLLQIAIWQPVLYFTCEVYGIKLTTASESAIIIALVPVSITVLAIILLKEKVTARQILCIAVAVTGVILMSVHGTPAGSPGSGYRLLGVAFLLGAVLAAGFYNVFSRQAAASSSPLEITFVMMALGAVVFNALGLGQAILQHRLDTYLTVLTNRSVLVGVLYLGIISSVLAFFMLNYSLSHLPASRVAVYLNLIPLVAVAAGVFFLHEQLSLRQAGGGMMVLLGVWGTTHWQAEKLAAQQ
ncbi:MAG: DMT family transporter [Desulfurispora sp.]|uniref:DMT family transporter n=1 Tax=Desulfurispora sp. TaxID=3014275 RepID=UPI00404B4F4C